MTFLNAPRAGGLAIVAAALAAACDGSGTGPRQPDPIGLTLVADVAIPPNYGIHDTYVRDGLAFVSAWNTGVIIFDVGDGRAGGSPEEPVEITRFVTTGNGVPGGPAVHNTWWFHNPANGEKRYLFVGQEGPASLFTSASGDLYVLDISDLANPLEVASLRIPGAGVHNFWMDEARQVLYAAWYNGGVVALDVSGTLSGDLGSRIITRVRPGGNNGTFVWGVMLANDALWVSDMVSGLWKLDPITLATEGGGGNIPDRWGSDLWVRGQHAYTGTWGSALRNGTGNGDAIKVWRVDGTGPELVDSVLISGISTVSDVEVSDDGQYLLATAESDPKGGLYIYDLTDPRRPALVASAEVPGGLHTGTFARIGGTLYAFTAKNPLAPSLRIYRLDP